MKNLTTRQVLAIASAVLDYRAGLFKTVPASETHDMYGFDIETDTCEARITDHWSAIVIDRELELMMIGYEGYYKVNLDNDEVIEL